MTAPRAFPEREQITMPLNDYFAVLDKFNSEIAAWRSEWTKLTGSNPAAIPESVKAVRKAARGASR